ncbi:MAG: DUF6262 family protein [Micropruina sp.]|uniref:DUF6262 family protein n=1 Tax=Micropruina sp. TaxID=2737536 RepID=UPI0039E44F1C
MSEASTDRLLAARRASANAKLERAKAALDALRRDGTPITFAAVARTAGVSTWLTYNHRELRKAIVEARDQAGEASPVDGSPQVSPAGLRAELEMARAEIRELRAEKAKLLQALGRRLGAELEGETPASLAEQLRLSRARCTELAAEVDRKTTEARQAIDERDNLKAELAAGREVLRRMMIERNADGKKPTAPHQSK